MDKQFVHQEHLEKLKILCRRTAHPKQHNLIVIPDSSKPCRSPTVSLMMPLTVTLKAFPRPLLFRLIQVDSNTISPRGAKMVPMTWEYERRVWRLFEFRRLGRFVTLLLITAKIFSYLRATSLGL